MTGVGSIISKLHLVTSRAWCNDSFREDKQIDMRLFETCMLAAYDTVTTRRGYVTVKLNTRKAKRIRVNQKIRDMLTPVAKLLKKKDANIVEDINLDEDTILL